MAKHSDSPNLRLVSSNKRTSIELKLLYIIIVIQVIGFTVLYYK